jgi:hypothetical protein
VGFIVSTIVDDVVETERSELLTSALRFLIAMSKFSGERIGENF